MQASLLNLTPPPSLGFKAFVGHTLTQGGSSQALHTTTVNPLSIPPMDLTPMHPSANPTLFCLLEQANMQVWQPTHLSVSTTDNLIACLWDSIYACQFVWQALVRKRRTIKDKNSLKEWIGWICFLRKAETMLFTYCRKSEHGEIHSLNNSLLVPISDIFQSLMRFGDRTRRHEFNAVQLETAQVLKFLIYYS